ncbi:MAG: SH3 domain-containing protein [Candidatus Lambdaproteobacteria bacterium]|nr:SH3 domain-containing protein [Candidatus Lambdaproteobacteria bacterium]
MKSRLIRIRGRTPELRAARLAVCERWMARRGWSLGDYADELGSAVFIRDGGALPPENVLPRWHPARLLPAPGTLYPLRLPSALPGGLLRRGAGGAWALALLSALFAVGLFALLVLQVGSPSLRQALAPAETWLYVTVESVNVREAPLAEAQIVGVLYLNQRVLVGPEKFGWVQVLQPEKGYVSRRFLGERPQP